MALRKSLRPLVALQVMDKQAVAAVVVPPAAALVADLDQADLPVVAVALAAARQVELISGTSCLHK